MQMMTTLPSLQNAFLRYAQLRGQLNCSLLSAARNLQRLSLSGNTKLVGELPGCFLQVCVWGWPCGLGGWGAGQRVLWGGGGEAVGSTVHCSDLA
jgi:hypothetical protein